MADLQTSAANELLTQLIMVLTRYGVDLAEAKIELYGMLHDYHIERNSTEMTVYEGNVNADLLQKFLAVKMVKGCSEKSVHFYKYAISKALLRLNKPAPQITVDDIRWYIALRMKDGVSAVTCNGELRALSSFFTWMQDDEIIARNPVIKTGKIKTQKEKKEAFTEEDIEKMRINLRTWREKALFELLLSTGCRVAEISNIRIKDLRPDGTVRVLGKGNKIRMAYINARARLAIDNYIAERHDDNPYLFAKSSVSIGEKSKGGRATTCEWYKHQEMVDHDEPMSVSTIETIIRHLGRKSGVGNAHPHRFRRTCATWALRRGMPLELVSQMLGHENVGTTQIYLDLSEEDLKMAHKKFVT